jgi:ferrochelatase
MAETWQPTARVAEPYFEDPAYIAALAAAVRRGWEGAEEEPSSGLLLSRDAQRYLMQGDPYHCQCQKTTRLLREALGWDRSQGRHHRSRASSGPRNGSSPTRRGGRAAGKEEA